MKDIKLIYSSSCKVFALHKLSNELKEKYEKELLDQQTKYEKQLLDQKYKYDNSVRLLESSLDQQMKIE